MTFKQDYLNQIDMLKKTLAQVDAVIVGAGAGLSTSAGFTYSGELFRDNFGEAVCPPQIENRSMCINKNIGEVLTYLLK